MIRPLAALLLFCALPLADAATPADYAVVLPIDTSAAADSSAFRIELTPDAYAWAQDASLRDIEVFNAQGRSVPLARFATEPAATTEKRSASLPVLALPPSMTASAASDLRLVIDRDADGRLRRIDAGEGAPVKSATRDWLVDASAFDRAIERIVLAWTEPASGVVARFAIDGSDDLQSWHPIGSATVLSLEQQSARVERRDIALGGARAKYLRLHRLDDGAELSGLTAEAQSIERGRAAPARAWMRADSTPPVEATTPGVVRFDYALKAALPIDGARIELGDDNALAPITLLARRSGVNEWMHIAQLTAFRLRQGDETIRNGDIDLTAATRVRELRIESRVPLVSAPQLTISYRPESFVFLAQGEGPYVLAAGSVRAQRVDYPLDAALASLRATLGNDWQPPLAALGTPRTSGGDAVLQPPPPPTPWRRWLLWAVLIGGALLVAGFAMSLLRERGHD